MTSRSYFSRNLQSAWPVAFTALAVAIASLLSVIAQAGPAVRTVLSAGLFACFAALHRRVNGSWRLHG
jgi:hypothetical protein